MKIKDIGKYRIVWIPDKSDGIYRAIFHNRKLILIIQDIGTVYKVIFNRPTSDRDRMMIKITDVKIYVIELLLNYENDPTIVQDYLTPHFSIVDEYLKNENKI